MRLVLLLSVTLVASSCLMTSKYTKKDEVVWGEDALRDLAAFDLKCSPEALIVSALGQPSEAGVTGCGGEGRYLMVSGRWIANSLRRSQ